MSCKARVHHTKCSKNKTELANSACNLCASAGKVRSCYILLLKSSCKIVLKSQNNLLCSQLLLLCFLMLGSFTAGVRSVGKNPNNCVVLLPTELMDIEQTRTQTSWWLQSWMRMTTGQFSPGPATGQRSQKTPKQVGIEQLLSVLCSRCLERNPLKRWTYCL